MQVAFSTTGKNLLISADGECSLIKPADSTAHTLVDFRMNIHAKNVVITFANVIRRLSKITFEMSFADNI